MSQGLISLKLVDQNDSDKAINLENLTHTGRQMVRDDLEVFLIKLDELDAVSELL